MSEDRTGAAVHVDAVHVQAVNFRGRGARELSLLMLYPIAFVAVYLSHWTLLRLPYFWDEAGYYVPAAYDFFRTGSLIPQTTLTNAHPPLPSLLLAGWWHLSGFVVSGTRTLVCLVAAAALLAIYRIGRRMAGGLVGGLAALLTAVYPIWFAQSTLAHADIFAAAFTLWALSFHLTPDGDLRGGARGMVDACGGTKERAWAAVLFSLAALSKETAIVTPLALAAFEALRALRARRQHNRAIAGAAWTWAAALLAPVLPLLAWYGFHYLRTGYVFGNPEYLRYNASANLDAHRITLAFVHRLLHLTAHMNLFVATLCTASTLLMPVRAGTVARGVPRRIAVRGGVVLLANGLAFSVLGGALLTRYLLPMYALVLLGCVTTWVERTRWWPAIFALTFSAFVAGIFIDPPYGFAPEDNLTYRDMIVVHQGAASYIAQHFPQATVLTAWPADAELSRPELGYLRRPLKVSTIENLSPAAIERAAAEPGRYDTALLFSTKAEPSTGQTNLGAGHEQADTRYFDLHHDLSPAEAARRLHGDVVWETHRRNQWAAVLRFPRVVNARIAP